MGNAFWQTRPCTPMGASSLACKQRACSAGGKSPATRRTTVSTRTAKSCHGARALGALRQTAPQTQLPTLPGVCAGGLSRVGVVGAASLTAICPKSPPTACCQSWMTFNSEGPAPPLFVHLPFHAVFAPWFKPCSMPLPFDSSLGPCSNVGPCSNIGPCSDLGPCHMLLLIHSSLLPVLLSEFRADEREALWG